MKKNVWLWLVSMFLLIASFGAFGDSIISGILIFIAAIGCNPIVIKYLKKIEKYPGKKIMIPAVILLFVVGVMIAPTKDSTITTKTTNVTERQTIESVQKEVSAATDNNEKDSTASNDIKENTTDSTSANVQSEKQNISDTTTSDVQSTNQQSSSAAITSDGNTMEYNGVTYKIIEVDGGDMSGDRQPSVAVDVGFGDRVYWAFTNEYGQLVNVIADKIILQDDSTEPVNSEGRYYDDEAAVPGTEQAGLDCGHVNSGFTWWK